MNHAGARQQRARILEWVVSQRSKTTIRMIFGQVEHSILQDFQVLEEVGLLQLLSQRERPGKSLPSLPAKIEVELGHGRQVTLPRSYCGAEAAALPNLCSCPMHLHSFVASIMFFFNRHDVESETSLVFFWTFQSCIFLNFALSMPNQHFRVFFMREPESSKSWASGLDQ